MDAAFGRSCSIRRGVNARDTSVRNREWSGGSIDRIPDVTRPARIRGASWSTATARLKRGSARTVRTSSYRVARHPSSPNSSCTRARPRVRRISAYSGASPNESGRLNG